MTQNKEKSSWSNPGEHGSLHLSLFKKFNNIMVLEKQLLEQIKELLEKQEKKKKKKAKKKHG